MVSTLPKVLAGAIVISSRQNKDDFTVAFVSCDHSEAQMRNFISGKGFLHVPFNMGGLTSRHSPLRSEIQTALGVSMLPTLVILDGTTGKVLTTWGRAAVSRSRCAGGTSRRRRVCARRGAGLRGVRPDEP